MKKNNAERKREYVRKQWDTNPDKYRALLRKYKIKNQYGLTPEDEKGMYDEQGGLCPGCGLPLVMGFHTVIDHNHITGKIRGLLCRKCNGAIGLANDSIPVLSNLIKYLERTDGKTTE